MDGIWSDPREDKLPEWARSVIGDLRRRLWEETKRAKTVLRAVPAEGSDAVLDRYTHEIGLGKDPRVKFNLGGLDSITAERQDGELYVISSRAMIIRPVVSNAVFIGVRPR